MLSITPHYYSTTVFRCLRTAYIHIKIFYWIKIAGRHSLTRNGYIGEIKEVNVEIEQSTIGDEHTVIYDFCKDSISPFTLGNVRIDVLDGADGLYHAIEFLHCQIIDHDLTFDYASGDVSKHPET